jgi:hypothetical protein
MKSKRATKETGARISCIATAMKADTQEIPISNFAGRLSHADCTCHPFAACVKCHRCGHAIVGTRLGPTQMRLVCNREFHGSGIAWTQRQRRLSAT